MHESSGQGPAVFIYGSCVSRDAFELPQVPPLVDYVARSAMGSAFSPVPDEAPSGLDLMANQSPFQRRMVQLDIEKGLPALLSSADFDVLLVDFIDERLELLPCGGSWITDSPEARACGLELPPASRVRVGSDDYFARFEHGLAKLVDLVAVEKIVLNRVLWATHTTEGDPLPNEGYIARHNDALRATYERALATGMRSIDYDPDLFVTDPTHRWGASPFHYGPDLYDATIRALRDL